METYDQQQCWEQANKAYFTAHLEALRQTLKRAVGTCADDDHPALVLSPMSDHDVPAALEILVAQFRLSNFERDILLLCAGVELDSEFTSLCALLQGNASVNFPTFHLALAALSDPHWSALAPGAPLRRWRLIEVEPTRVLTYSPLRIDERIMHYLVGVSYLDTRLTALFQPLPGNETLILSQQVIAQKILEVWSLAAQKGDAPIVVQLCGREPGSLRDIAGWLACHCDCPLFMLSVSMLPTNVSELEEIMLLWERESTLNRCLLLLDCSGLDRIDSAHEYAMTRVIEAHKGPLLLTSHERRPLSQQMVLTFDIQKPTVDEQRTLWRAAFGSQADALSGLISRLVAHFYLDAPAIAAVGAGVQGYALAAEQMPDVQELSNVTWSLCRTQARPRLDDLAKRIEPVATWADLIVSDTQRAVLREIVMHVQQRTQVYETWGFGRKGLHSSGISALFAGVSGVGKTLTAEVLAHELHLDLYRVDLSMVVSKYIGETEKNLRRIFDTAEESGAILLFDEADALFGKRSEVKDSHDRHANIEVSYLLQRMEAYHGLVILTSNVKDALDQAFLRRIRFIVQFPFPEIEQRVEIWRRIFPAAAPTEGLDLQRLAQLNVAGGNIRNIALNAAVIAADAGGPICMEHLLRAARYEYSKLERSLTSAETRGW